MALLTRAEILDADDLPFEDVPVPEWGGSVRIRTMTGAQRDDFRAAMAGEPGEQPRVGKFSAALLAACCVDEAGQPLFTMADMEALQAKNAKSLDAPAAVAGRLNGLLATSIKDAVKNSESGQSDDSGSGLPKS